MCPWILWHSTADWNMVCKMNIEIHVEMEEAYHNTRISIQDRCKRIVSRGVSFIPPPHKLYSAKGWEEYTDTHILFTSAFFSVLLLFSMCPSKE